MIVGRFASESRVTAVPAPVRSGLMTVSVVAMTLTDSLTVATPRVNDRSTSEPMPKVMPSWTLGANPLSDTVTL